MKTLVQSQEDITNSTEKKSSNDKCCGISKKSGIYKIINKINQHYYVGRSNNFQSRWQAHRNKLRKGLHDNEHLQNAWNKYGPAAFEFIVVEYVDGDISNQQLAEVRYIRKFIEDRRDGIFNCCNKSDSAGGGGTLTEAGRLRMKQKATGKKPTDEVRRKLSEMAKARVARDKLNKTGIFSDEHRKLVSQINLNNTHALGKSHTEETKQKIGNSLRNRNHTQFLFQN